MKLPYDLTRKTSDSPCVPCNPGDYSPSIHFDGDKDFGFPESGLVTFRFKRASRNENDRDGKKSFSVCLECKEIVAIKADKKAEPDEKSTGEVLDGLLEETQEADE